MFQLFIYAIGVTFEFEIWSNAMVTIRPNKTELRKVNIQKAILFKWKLWNGNLSVE